MLVEFGLISLAFYFLLAGVLALGRAIFAAQTVQNAARVMARELATAPLPATMGFYEALASPYVRARVYDERALVVDLDAHPAGPALDAHFATLPIINQMLRPVYIRDRLPDGTNVLRYPGALLRDPTGALVVRIPRILDRGANGVETIDWVTVVSEVRPQDNDPSIFGIDDDDASTVIAEFRGMVSLRIHYPFQAASLSSFRNGGGNPFQSVNVASDAGVQGGLPPGFSSVFSGDPAQGGPYAGSYGLGAQYALGKRVRPFRKLLIGQAVQRREVFQ